MRVHWITALGACFVLAAQAIAEPKALTVDQWQADLEQMTAAIREIHFKPFHVVSEDEFDTSVANLRNDIPTLSDQDIILRMAQIVAALRDGHSRLQIPRLYPELALQSELGHSGTPPPRVDSLRFRQLPVRFELFSDGLFVVGATAEHHELIGQEVLLLDETSTDEAIAAVRAVSFFENDSRARLMAPDRLALPDVLNFLDISTTGAEITLTTINNDGHTSRTILSALDAEGRKLIDGAPQPKPMWRARRDEYRWHQVLADDDAIYVQVNEFEESPVIPYGDFVAEAIDAARDAGVNRFVIDLRHNSGGIGAWVTPFVTGLSRSEYNEYGRLYVLVSRETFSAAEHFLHRFEEYTYAAFVGEQSGAMPSHFGDPQRIVLENSGLTLRVSTIYWHSWLANDFREAINPHISVPYSSSDFFSASDPVLQAALDYDAPENLALQIDEQFRRGNNQNALLMFVRYMSDATIADHRQAIPELLAMADRLVEDGYVRPGYFVYFLANQSYPGNPDVEASLERIQELMNESDD